MKRKLFFTDILTHFFEKSGNDVIFYATLTGLMIVFYIVFCLVLDSRLQNALPEKQEQFEANYETIYEPKYEVLETALKGAMNVEKGLDIFAFKDVGHHIAFEDDKLVVTVELKEEDETYPYQITTKFSHDYQILSHESEKISKDEFVNSNIKSLKIQIGTNAWLYSVACLICCIFVFFVLWGFSALHKDLYIKRLLSAKRARF